VLRVIDPKDNVIIDRTARGGEQVLSAAVADNVTDVLVDVVTTGTGQRAAVDGHPIAGKTGTTQEYRAAWFVGYTPTLATAVWMGHADGLAPLRNINGVPRVTGGSHPAIAFSAFMRDALFGKEAQAFPPPPDLAQFDTADDVIALADKTAAGVRSDGAAIAPDCDGPCRIDGVPEPALDPPEVTTIPPSTIAPSTDVPPSTNGSVSSTDPPTTDPAGPTIASPPGSTTTSAASSTTTTEGT
jgi:membrane peptidoglycan carboxypeptidase